MALTSKERSARHYLSRKENGLCPRCGSPLDRTGHYCSRCLEKFNTYQKETRSFYREHHICTQCGKNKVFGSERCCPECRAKMALYRKPLTSEQKIRTNDHRRVLYKARKDSGICTRCGKRKASPGRSKCGICLEKDVELHRKKHDKEDYKQVLKIENN